MLNDLLALHCSIRNKSAYSNKAKNANLQRYAEAFSFLQSKNLYTVDDLENTLHSMQDKIDALKKSASAKQARIKEVDALLRMVDYYKSGNLSLEEAAAYSGIGINKLREITNEDRCKFVLWVGNKRLIKRRLFDQFIEQAYSI